jgi:hypothetical protein
MFNPTEIKQGLIAAVAAIVLTVTAVGAAVAPAEAVASPVFASLQADRSTHG